MGQNRENKNRFLGGSMIDDKKAIEIIETLESLKVTVEKGTENMIQKIDSNVLSTQKDIQALTEKIKDHDSCIQQLFTWRDSLSWKIIAILVTGLLVPIILRFF
jgi:hypothetical protein